MEEVDEDDVQQVSNHQRGDHRVQPEEDSSVNQATNLQIDDHRAHSAAEDDIHSVSEEFY